MNERQGNEKPSPVGKPISIRPSWWTGDDDNDWPEDFAHENGNYFGNCCKCRKDFVGHKCRYICRKCQKAEDARWAAMSKMERQSELAKLAEAIEAWRSS